LTRPLNWSRMPCQAGNGASGCGAISLAMRIMMPSEPEAAGPQGSIALTRDLAHRRGDIARADAIADDTQDARRCVVQRRRGRIAGNIILGGEVQNLVGVVPVEHALDAALDDRHFGAQHVEKRAVEDRSHLDRCLVGARHELPPKIEIAVLTGRGLREVGGVVGRDEPWHVGLHSRVR
jgi:hypothetical protein